MHVESLQRSISHRTTTYFVHQCRFIRALRRPFFPWVNCQYVYASSPLRSANGKSGHISLSVPRASYFALLCWTTIGGASLERKVLLSFRLDVHDGKLQSLLIESIVLLESVTNSRYFSRTSIILFLTGIDELKVKLPKVRYNVIHVLGFYSFRQVPLESYFPEYTGGVDIDKAAAYILSRFMQVNRARLNVHSQ